MFTKPTIEIAAFDYALPEEKIAFTPAPNWFGINKSLILLNTNTLLITFQRTLNYSSIIAK
jgi:hypothetical protein